jgi:predicted nucleic acid-binding Zn ribbon protein
MDDAQLRTAWQQRQFYDRTAHLSAPLAVLTRRILAKKVRQLSQLAHVWDEIIPENIADHTALESLNRGTLTVVVDSAPHRFQLQMLLNAGLLKDLQKRFIGALEKVRLVPGQFSSVDINGQERYEFDTPQA